ncbi:MAG: hypothetical protein AAB131_10155 [Actinomycetota bacterium]
MAWDSSRPVPWQRLIRDWLLYVAIMVIVFAFVYRDRLTPGIFAGLLASGPVIVVIGAVLAKFGYQRKTMRDLRRQAARPPAADVVAPGRSKPAATRRTGGGPTRPGSTGRKR